MSYSPSKSYTLYWSSLDRYENCPRSFLWGRGWGDLDVGGGPGRKKPVPIQKSEHHAIMGIVIQSVVEAFYNSELWKLLGPVELRDRLMALADENLRLECSRKFIDWRIAGSRDEMEKLIKDGILGYMRTLKQHKLLGTYARCEVDLLGYIDKYNPIGGRCDLMIRREQEPNKGVLILDGKNSKRYKDGKVLKTHTDPDQLRWYALCFYLAYAHALPDKLGFLYYRYPYGAPVLDIDGKPTGEIEQGVDWVPFTKDDLKGLAQRAVDARKGMDKERFDPTPTPKGCKYCDYESVCDARIAQKAANRRAPRNTDAKLDGLQPFAVFSFED
jgi:hypothetical protein